MPQNVTDRLRAARAQWDSVQAGQFNGPQVPSVALDNLLELPMALKRLRERRNISIAALSRDTGIGYTTLWRMEQLGAVSNPGIETVLLLAEYFAVPLTELLPYPTQPAGEGDTPPIGELLSRLQGTMHLLEEHGVTAELSLTVRPQAQGGIA